MSRLLTKLLDIGPGGVIYPGSAQDFRYHGNPEYFADTRTPWIRMWADWPSLQPAGDHAIDDPASPGHWRLLALDAQIALANARGVRVLLLPYRFPPWANGTAELATRRDTDAEIAFEHEDRMTPAAWARYLRHGRDPEAYTPSRRALEYRLPGPDAYGPFGQWARFFDFLYRRYHLGRHGGGPRVHGFELVNEPNLQLWPQAGAAAAVAQLMQTAQAISARYWDSTLLLAPSLGDGGDSEDSRLRTPHDEFVPALLDALDALGYRPHAGQAWSHHNYTDVEHRQAETTTQAVRARLAGRWTGYASGRAPTVFVTEGGARLSRMAELYPREEPRAAQARCLREAWALHASDSGAGAGVAMLAQYLLYADPNFDCGLIDPYPSTVRRPAYEAWKSFPGFAGYP